MGVFASSKVHEAVHGETQSPTYAAIAGISQNPSGTGAGIYGESRGKGPAGFFKGNVMVTGDVILTNADCAEDFPVDELESVEPGTVVVFDDDSKLRCSQEAYDRRVAGVISGAGDYKPGIILDRPTATRPAHRMPLALIGKVFCKVDASHGAIRVGDLMTSSSTPGHAMVARDTQQAVGAIIGKALRALDAGRGLIPILVSLQ